MSSRLWASDFWESKLAPSRFLTQEKLVSTETILISASDTSSYVLIERFDGNDMTSQNNFITFSSTVVAWKFWLITSWPSFSLCCGSDYSTSSSDRIVFIVELANLDCYCSFFIV